MKSFFNILTISILALPLITGCRKEAKLSPTPGRELLYGDSTLPQGNHPYDADIVALYGKYKTLFLYKYVPNDLYYNVNTWLGGTYDTPTNMITRPGRFDVPADQAWVGTQLNLLKQIWLNFYPDAFLKQGLPQKVFMLDSFYYAAYMYPYKGPGKPSDYIYEYDEVYMGGDNMIVTWGSARLNAMTQQQQYEYKANLNNTFLKFARQKNAVQRNPAFTALTDFSSLNWSNYQDQGVLSWDITTPDADWDSYVNAIVSNSHATLQSPGNILSPDFDTKGVVRKKYDIITAYFIATYGVDLQAIGNAGS